MKVLQVCAELFPLIKTGGLADVCGALPGALAARGVDMRVLVPGYPAILRGVPDARPIKLTRSLPTGVRLLKGTLPSTPLSTPPSTPPSTADTPAIPLYLIDAPLLFAREGNPYADVRGEAYADNHRRFALLCRVAALLAHGLDAAWSADLVHSHDWHAGLAPAYLHAAMLHGQRKVASVHTVHNLAFQGLFPSHLLTELGLPMAFYRLSTGGLEFHHQISFMKAGLHYADRITTVSPTYAREIQGQEQGCGLDGVLRERAGVLSGILNGVDEAVWSPAADTQIAARYTAMRLAAGKRRCRAALQKASGLALQDSQPVFGVVSRMTEQKGVKLILDGLPELLARGGQLVVLGSGEPALVAALQAAAAAHPQSVAVTVGYDEALAHRVVAGADVILVPSHFEPCGLTQLYGLKYGTLPLVHRVGGLADTVADCSLENLDEGLATGFVFERFELPDYQAALRRAFALFARPEDWRTVQRRAMAQDFGWDAAAARYVEEYNLALASPSSGAPSPSPSP